MSETLGDVIGWFSEEGQTVPDHDPPHDALCLYCGIPIEPEDVRTHCFVPAKKSERWRSWIYRTHRICDDAASETMKSSVFSGVCELITKIEGRAP